MTEVEAQALVVIRRQAVKDVETQLRQAQVLLAEAVIAEAAARPACDGFAWIGQSFKHCDDCGKAYWEHTHEKRAGSILGGDYRLVPITPEQAAACKEKWA